MNMKQAACVMVDCTFVAPSANNTKSARFLKMKDHAPHYKFVSEYLFTVCESVPVSRMFFALLANFSEISPAIAIVKYRT